MLLSRFCNVGRYRWQYNPNYFAAIPTEVLIYRTETNILKSSVLAKYGS